MDNPIERERTAPNRNIDQIAHQVKLPEGLPRRRSDAHFADSKLSTPSLFQRKQSQ
jgi:hypothetical protein